MSAPGATMHQLRFAATILVAGAAACTASWNTLVRYSNEAASPDQPLEESVYAAALRSMGPYQALVIDTSPRRLERLWGMTTAGRVGVPGYWADTLKRELRVALSDTSRRQWADSALLTWAAERVGIAFVSSASAESVEVAHRNGGKRPFAPIIPRITMSRPGFNRDSTIAVIDVSIVCGGLCGAGQTLFLARRPVFQWRAWGGQTHWVS